MRDFERLERQCDRVLALIDEGEAVLALRVPEVSGWSVGQQVDHVLRILDRGLARVEKGGKTPAKGVNLVGRICLATGWLPRGVAKAPEGMDGQEVPAAEMRERLAVLRDRPEGMRPGERVLPHPYFGGLDLPQTVRFWGVHTAHHLKIVDDIRRAARA